MRDTKMPRLSARPGARLRLCAGSAMLALLATPAQAVRIGEWDVTPQTSRGQFHHCLMLSDSDPDVKLGFAKAPGRFSIIFSAADWDVRKGRSARLQVSTGSETRQVQAVATEDGVAMIDLHGDDTFLQNLSDSGTLAIRLPARALRIKLPAGHFEAFGKLEECAARRGRI